MVHRSGKRSTVKRKLGVVYARREPSTDPQLPSRAFAKDVVIASDCDFRQVLTRFRWNDHQRPTRAGPRFVRLDGVYHRIQWAEDVPYEQE